MAELGRADRGLSDGGRTPSLPPLCSICSPHRTAVEVRECSDHSERERETTTGVRECCERDDDESQRVLRERERVRRRRLTRDNSPGGWWKDIRCWVRAHLQPRSGMVAMHGRAGTSWAHLRAPSSMLLFSRCRCLLLAERCCDHTREVWGDVGRVLRYPRRPWLPNQGKSRGRMREVERRR